MYKNIIIIKNLHYFIQYIDSDIYKNFTTYVIMYLPLPYLIKKYACLLKKEVFEPVRLQLMPCRSDLSYCQQGGSGNGVASRNAFLWHGKKTLHLYLAWSYTPA